MAILQLNSTGPDVLSLQQKLIKLGYPISADGIYGNQTFDAVKSYQAFRHLMQDGIAGDVTMSTIDHDLASPQILGIDVSTHNGLVDWAAVQNSGKVNFAVIKATEGATIQDDRFAGNLSELQRIGLPYGAYHFFRFFTSTPEDQANNYNQTVGKSNLQQGTLAPIVDVEYQDSLGTTNNAVKTQRQVCADRLRKYVDMTIANFGRTPIIYTTANFWDDILGSPSGFENCPLWIADYSSKTAPAIPKGWKQQIIWQNTDKAQVEGLPDKVDWNIFNGDQNAFSALLNM